MPEVDITHLQMKDDTISMWLKQRTELKMLTYAISFM